MEEHHLSVLTETAKRRALLLRRIPDIAAELQRQPRVAFLSGSLDTAPDIRWGYCRNHDFYIRPPRFLSGIGKISGHMAESLYSGSGIALIRNSFLREFEFPGLLR